MHLPYNRHYSTDRCDIVDANLFGNWRAYILANYRSFEILFIGYTFCVPIGPDPIFDHRAQSRRSCVSFGNACDEFPQDGKNEIQLMTQDPRGWSRKAITLGLAYWVLGNDVI